MKKNCGQPVFEPLESRQLLAAGGPVQCIQNGGMLEVTGTSGDDEITLVLQGDSQAQSATVKVVVGHGRQAATKVFEGVNCLWLYSRAGNDRITVTGVMNDYWLAPNINAGDGNDRVFITNYNGYVWVSGDGGNDLIDASRAFAKYAIIGRTTQRWLYGSDGNDRIIGSSCADTMYGNDGNDVLIGGAGDDYLEGGSGHNVLTGNDGNDTFGISSLTGLSTGPYVGFNNFGGYDRIDGGRGNDMLQLRYNSTLGPWSFGFVAKSVEVTTFVDVASWYGGGMG